MCFFRAQKYFYNEKSDYGIVCNITVVKELYIWYELCVCTCGHRCVCVLISVTEFNCIEPLDHCKAHLVKLLTAKV